LDPAAGQSATWIIRRHDASNHSRINWHLKGCIDYKTETKKLARNLTALEHRLSASSSTYSTSICHLSILSHEQAALTG
jgi:hypothetical protein